MKDLQLLKIMANNIIVVFGIIWEYFFCLLKTKRTLVGVIIITLFLFIFIYIFFIDQPKNFKEQSFLLIPEGATLNQVSKKLYDQDYISSPFWFKSTIKFFYGENSIKAGEYFFADSKNVFVIAKRLASGDLGLEPKKVTITEGQNIFQMANLLSKQFLQFDSEHFIKNAPEGYLFPDTYLFLPNIKSQDVILTMTQNFNKQIFNIKNDLEKSGYSLHDVIKMASILEKEARSFEVRQTIAGILWKRLEIGMPLQVDVAFAYVNGKNSFTLTTKDLLINSPYNTYINKGLPPTPIANPGLEAIRAAINPIKTKYLYFLTDNDGIMRYSSDYEGHLKNRRLYLGK